MTQARARSAPRVAARAAVAKSALADLDDPHFSSSAGGFSPNPSEAIRALGLRQAKWSEVGPDIFFFGVNGVVALFAAALYFSGALPSAAALPAWGAPLASYVPLAAAAAQVLAVNLTIMVLAYGGYHKLFHEGLYERLTRRAPTKFNPAPYESGQLEREVTYTTVAMVIASVYHVIAIIGKTNGSFLQGALPAFAFDAETALFFGRFALFGLLSDAHFFVVHRFLHIPAVYAVAHKLHHMSKNPGPWSGLSMHPIESAIYLSKVFIPFLFTTAHPLHFLFMLYNATLMPIPGHSGHQEALGNEYHWIHHHTFQVRAVQSRCEGTREEKIFHTHPGSNIRIFNLNREIMGRPQCLWINCLAATSSCHSKSKAPARASRNCHLLNEPYNPSRARFLNIATMPGPGGSASAARAPQPSATAALTKSAALDTCKRAAKTN